MKPRNKEVIILLNEQIIIIGKIDIKTQSMSICSDIPCISNCKLYTNRGCLAGKGGLGFSNWRIANKNMSDKLIQYDL